MERLLLLIACLATGSAHGVELEPLWKTTGLANPESVLADGDVLYVSNVDGEGDAKDGKGFIARLDRNGRVLDRHWVDGLDAPKGMALVSGRLFVADVTALVEIDVASGKIIARHEAPAANFLNDVAVAPNGDLLVADSGTSRIYAWKRKRFRVWLEDAALRSVNGLLPEPQRVIVTTMQGKLLAADWTSRALTELAAGLGNADGVAALDASHYLVGEWPGRLFDVAPDGTHRVLRDTRAEIVDVAEYQNDFLRIGDLLVVPNWEPSTLSAYRLR